METVSFQGKGDSSRIRRTQFALQIVRFYCQLPKTTEAQVLGKQVLRSGTSVGALYAEASRARSTAEFVSKLQGGLQELQETLYWLELLKEAQISESVPLQRALCEAEELIRIFVSSVRTVKKNR